MKKRIFSMVLSLMMLIIMWPADIVWAATVSYDESSSRNATITVTDESGNPITGATVTVTRNGDTFVVQEIGNGQYKFTRNTTLFFYSYSITVAKEGYETVTQSMVANRSSVSVELSSTITTEIQAFRVFYIADGNLPANGYSAGGNAADYGPSANNTPLVTINVNMTMLREIAAQDNSPVVWTEDTGSNYFEVSAVGDPTDADALDNVKAFWDAVLTCIDEESITAFEETGLFDHFLGYSMKHQKGDSSFHLDGILAVSPPVYVVELYQNETYFGGAVTDVSSEFPTMYDLLDQYEAHLKQNITWEEDANGKPLRKTGTQYDYYTGTYIDAEAGKIHTITVYQYPDDSAVYVENETGASEFPYAKRTDTYYYTKFNMSVDAGTSITYVVTYTDGVAGEEIFNDHEYAASYGDTVPPFTGATLREEYTFLGWTLEGDSTGTVYSDADIAAMTVQGDMVFNALWQAVPKYTGTVKLVLNGAYDSATGTLTSGTLVDPVTVLGETAQVYVSTDGVTYEPLTRAQAGEYHAFLKNGVYHIYYSTDGSTYTLASNQAMTIENADRTRYLFYNSVTYDANGGTLDGAATKTDYYYSGTAVTVTDVIPVRDGYLFDGWEDEQGTVYASSATLTDAIGEAYTLTARWIKATNVYVHITLNHTADDGHENNDDAMHNVAFTVDTRPAGSNGNFTEIFAKELLWDGESAFDDGTYTVDYSENKTVYTAILPTVTNVSTENEYTVTKTKTGYSLISVTSEYDENGDLQVYATLQYDPENTDFTWTVELDEASKQLPVELWPKAVNVKVVYWDSDALDWLPIAPQEHTYERVELSADGVGTGSFSVHTATTDQTPIPYYYRVIVVSYELQDGSVVAAESNGDTYVDYICAHKRYTTTIEVTGGAAPDGATALSGSYYENETWNGDVTAVVSVPVYTVTFIPNGGVLNGTEENTVLEDQIIGPDLSLYVPTRDDGYVFDGWYLYENGVMTETAAVSFADLTSDLTLIAKWRDPVTVDGMVTVGATYEYDDEFREILESDRATHVEVLLQKKLPSGYYETLQEHLVTIAYDDESYYFEGRVVGHGEFSFSNLPDDGSEYRITVLSANYTATYQDEPESVTDAKWAYNTYDIGSYMALFGETQPLVATVNAHLHFTPPEFDLQFQVDASQIGQTLRPQGAGVLITCQTGDVATLTPDQWQVITQLVSQDDYTPLSVILDQNGVGDGSYPVWRVNYDGASKYDYGLRLYSTVNGESVTLFDENPYFTVSYQAPAHYNLYDASQSQLLVAALVPKTYNILYETNGGTIFGVYGHTHTWSHETTLSTVTPVRDGYRFDGWYWDEALTQPLASDTIGAEVAEDVVFYAKWTKISVQLQVLIDHETENGTAKDFEKLLQTQLVSRPANSEEPYTAVSDHSREYDNSYWHNEGETLDYFEYSHVHAELSDETDYTVEVVLDGYRTVESYTYVSEDGSITFTTGTTKTVVNQDDALLIQYNVVVCLEAEVHKLVFHANNAAVQSGEDVFRTYYEVATEQGTYSLNGDCTVPTFYEIPTFEYDTHNHYIFKGWYTADGTPWDRTTDYNLVGVTEDTHLYAQWITVDTVATEAADGKNMEYVAHPGAYPGFDLMGVQIRESTTDNGDHHGTAGSGLRFVAVLGNRVYDELTALWGADVEYGFAVAKTSAARRYAGDTAEYTLQCNGTNINGVDTTTDYKYVKNMVCSGVQDHYQGEAYRLYTTVITYGDKTGDALEAAQAVNFIARPYVCYTDANGLTRTYYNNYTGTPLYSGCSTSFAAVRELVAAQTGGDVQ